MRFTTPVFVLAIALTAPTVAQAVDDSCRAVQAMSAEQRVRALPPSAANQALLGEIRDKLQEGTEAIRAAEKDYANNVKPIFARVKDTNPNLSDYEAETRAYQQARENIAAGADARLDAALARELVVQANAHQGEKDIIVKVTAIPRPGDEGRVATQAMDLVRDRGLPGNAYDLAQKSPTFQHLLGTLRASQVAASAPAQMPAAPLAAALARAATAPAREGFDVPPPNEVLSPGDYKLVATASAHAAAEVAEANAERQRSGLILDHLQDYLGDAKTRTSLTQARSTATVREASAEVGEAINGVVMQRAVLERLNHLDLQPEAKKPNAASAIAKKVEDEVQIIYHHVRGTTPPSTNK